MPKETEAKLTNLLEALILYAELIYKKILRVPHDGVVD